MTTEEQTPSSLIDAQFKSLQDNLLAFSKNVKSLQEEVKQLQKTCKQIEKQSRMKKKRPQLKMAVDKDLSKFLNLAGTNQLTKAEVMKQVSTYIKENNLQLKNDKRKFKPNKDLCKLFGMKVSGAKDMTFVEINKHVSQHLTKLEIPTTA